VKLRATFGKQEGVAFGGLNHYGTDARQVEAFEVFVPVDFERKKVKARDPGCLQRQCTERVDSDVVVAGGLLADSRYEPTQLVVCIEAEPGQRLLDARMDANQILVSH
jgi:hypothetical protein